jgi:hypothetical protein
MVVTRAPFDVFMQRDADALTDKQKALCFRPTLCASIPDPQQGYYDNADKALQEIALRSMKRLMSIKESLALEILY